MATKYVRTDGSNANDGTVDDAAHAWLTTTYAVSQVATGDTISIAGGTYNNEKFSTGDKSITFVATGAVIWDGTSTTAAPMATLNSSTNTRTATFTGTATNTFTFQNYTGASSLIYQNAGILQNVSFTYCNFIGNSNTLGFEQLGAFVHVDSFYYCNFSGVFTAAGLYIATSSQTCAPILSYCTVTGQNIGFYFNRNTPVITNCTFTNNKYPVVVTLTTIPTASNNTYIGSYAWGQNSVFYSWAGWKALSATCDNVGSTSDSLGLAVYVNKSGNDDNLGFSPNTAKLTIQSAINSSVTGNYVIVGSGSYNERLSWATKGIYLGADGTVILDGTGLGAGSAIATTSATSSGGVVTISSYNAAGKWIIQNWSSATVISLASSGTAYQTLRDITIISSGNTTALNLYSGSATTYTVQNCIFAGFTVAITSTTQAGNHYNNTFYNCTTAIDLNLNSVASIFNNNIYHTCTTAIDMSSATMVSIGSQNQYYNVTNWKWGANTDTTLAAWQARGVGWDVGSIVEDPQFEDAANNIFFLKVPSSISRTQGAIPFGYTTGSNASDAKWIITASADNTGWYNADGNVTKNGTTGFFELTSGSSGVIVSPIIDLGSVQAIKGVNLAVDQTWGTNMVDTTTSDVKPNYQTIRIRGSGTTFNQDAVSPSWTEVKTEQPISIISGRYIQLELTLRSNDVAA